MSRSRRNRPRYPALAAALALAASGCGPLEEELGRLVPPTRVDGGTVEPQPPDFFGGDAAWEMLPDGGVVR